MAVTLDNINIETVVDIIEKQMPRINQTPIGNHSLVLSQSMKSAIHTMQVVCVWSGGASDFTAKKRHLQNIADSGLPVWFDAQDWGTNQMLFGKIHDVEFKLSEGRVNVYDVTFLIDSVFPWGYLFVQSDGTGDFRVYDLDKRVQSRTLNPLLRRCNFTKTGITTITFSIFVKNIGGVSGQVTLEMMVPDDFTTGSVSVSPAVTLAQNTVGSTNFSTSPGSKNRITMKRTLGANVEEQWDVTLSLGSFKTSFFDGSIDDQAG